MFFVPEQKKPTFYKTSAWCMNRGEVSVCGRPTKSPTPLGPCGTDGILDVKGVPKRVTFNVKTSAQRDSAIPASFSYRRTTGIANTADKALF
ncbi:hypothetical protein V1264_022726 [Littorina saxatilis]|uniref:Uncharacterized protein n=1 Tax=Littorina saxatilis TaxID=31220 RepID=A0AAN9B6G7_9CAEN